MKINANELRPGNVIEYQGRLWSVARIQHTQPGKGGAYIQAEMKDIKSGTKLNERFRSSETIEKARLDQREYQYLYMDGQQLVVMDNNSYEQMNLPQELAGDALQFLSDGMTITVESYEGEALRVMLPNHVTLQVEDCEPAIKGQTAANSYKPATVQGGVRVMVPPFIEAGEMIVINTEDGIYVERAK